MDSSEKTELSEERIEGNPKEGNFDIKPLCHILSKGLVISKATTQISAKPLRDNN